MGQFVDGEWKSGWYSNDKDGKFERPDTTFRNTITKFEPGRYHLYVSWACPWAHRTLIARSLLGLKEQISISVVDWFLDDEGWSFNPDRPGATPDHLYGSRYLREIYKKADDHYTGRVTVPILWDKEEETIVNNESREVLSILCRDLKSHHAKGVPDLCPADRKAEIDDVISRIYQPINNGVYKAGFATSQEAYDEAVNALFQALDLWDSHVEQQPFLVGENITEADICLFTTLIRFDPVYLTHFKCSRKKISEYKNLGPYLERLMKIPGVSETCHLDHIVNHYYQSHTKVNPTGIVATLPESYSWHPAQLPA